jgi:YgiT-type zinc finger domain-containing protein
MSCPKCKGEMERIRGRYHFVECGLENVYLGDWPIDICVKCGTRMPIGPDPHVFTQLLVDVLVHQKGRLNGDSILFLRKAMRLKATELANLLKTSRQEISRWENDHTDISSHYDARLRKLAIDRLLPEELKDETHNEVAGVLYKEYEPKHEATDITALPTMLDRFALA